MHRLPSIGRSVGFSLCVFSFFFIPYLAADGDLDPAFGVDGKLVFLGDSAATDEFLDVCLQADGKIIGIGYTSGQGGWDVTVARFNGDGSFDPTFGLGGRMIYDAGAEEFGMAGVLLEDGHILVVGERDVAGEPEILMMRILADGSLDASFGTAGFVSMPGGYADDVLLLPDNRIIVGATIKSATGDDFALFCLEHSGSLDATFAIGGYVQVDFGGNDQLRRLALTLGGHILAAGFSESGDLLVTMITPAGTLDPGFGTAGRAIFTSQEIGASVGGRSSVGLGVQLDGRIVVGTGHKEADPLVDISDSDVILVRLEPDGTLDASFGTGGVSMWDLTGSDDILGDLAIQLDGKILAIGTVYPVHYGDFLVQRYNSDGSPDMTFGPGGWVATDFGWGDRDGARAVVIQPDGRIVVAGHGPDQSVDSWDIGLVRYLCSIDADAALATLRSSFDTFFPDVDSLTRFVEHADRHLDRERRRPVLSSLSILERRIRLLTATAQLAPEYRRRVLEVISAIRLRMGGTIQPVEPVAESVYHR